MLENITCIHNFIVIYTFEFHQIFMGFGINSFREHPKIIFRKIISIRERPELQ